MHVTQGWWEQAELGKNEMPLSLLSANVKRCWREIGHLSLLGDNYPQLVWLRIVTGGAEMFWLLGSLGALKCVHVGCLAICVHGALWSCAGHSSHRCTQCRLIWATLDELPLTPGKA